MIGGETYEEISGFRSYPHHVFMILIPTFAMAETITDILPDTTQWGISRTKFKELNGKNYADIEIPEKRCSA